MSRLFCVAVVFWSVCVCIRAGVAETPDGVGVIEEMRLIWDSARTQVACGEFEARLYRFFDSEGSHLGRERLTEIIEDVCANPDQRHGIDGMLDGENIGKWSKSRSDLWNVKIQAIFEGSRVKNITHKKTGEEIRVFDGENELFYDPANRQARIDAGRLGYEKVDINRLSMIPAEKFASSMVSEAKAGRLEVRSVGEGVWRASNERFVMEFDRDTGFIRRYQTLDRRGMPQQEVRQFHPVDAGGGFQVPRFAISTKFNKDYVRMFSLYSVDSFKMNESIPDDAFALGVPAGQTVFDYRVNRKSPAVKRASGDGVRDVIAFMDGLTPMRREGGSGLLPALSAVVGSLLLAAAAFWVIRRSGRSKRV